MYRATVALDTNTLATLQRFAETLPEQTEAITKRVIRPFVSRAVDHTLRRAPGPVKYPIRWTSAKQRRAFFATDGFGHGIPYKRTGALVRSWHVRGDYRRGLSSISVYNDADAAQFVQGARQQGFHKDTGWTSAANELQRISLEANDLLNEELAGLWFNYRKGRA